MWKGITVSLLLENLGNSSMKLDYNKINHTDRTTLPFPMQRVLCLWNAHPVYSLWRCWAQEGELLSVSTWQAVNSAYTQESLLSRLQSVCCVWTGQTLRHSTWVITWRTAAPPPLYFLIGAPSTDLARLGQLGKLRPIYLPPSSSTSCLVNALLHSCVRLI